MEQEGTTRSARGGRGRTSFDSTMAIRRDPYRFISRTAEARGTDAFETRLLLERTLFVTGAEAARFFYDGTVFKRDGATPEFLKSTLFGRGGVQGLDGPAHHHRKEMFLRLFGRGRTGELTDTATAAIREALQSPGAFALQDRTEEALTAAVSAWAGLPASGDTLPDRTRMISNLFEHAAPVDVRHLLARLSRRRADSWAATLVDEVRAERLTPPPESALAVIAEWREPDGERLPSHVAAVELLNALRPFVAISAYITFAAHALATRPEEVEALRADSGRLPWFVQEVRRTYPFFPVLAARVRQPTTWQGFDLPAERLVVLDIWGTNRDPSAWSEPGRFDPRALPRLERRSLHPHPSGRRRSRQRPPLPRRMGYARLDADCHPGPRRSRRLATPPRAGLLARHAQPSGPATRPHPARSALTRKRSVGRRSSATSRQIRWRIAKPKAARRCERARGG